jgi:lipoteichoic acid synthase
MPPQRAIDTPAAPRDARRVRFLGGRERAGLVPMLWALVAVVLGIKLGKVAFAFVDKCGVRAASGSWLLRGALIGLACWGLTRLEVLRRPRFARLRPVLIGLPAGLFLLGKVALAVRARDPERAYGWLVMLGREGANVGRVLWSALRADVLFLASFALLAHALTWLVPERLRPRVTKGIGVVVALLVVFAGLELAQYCKTGLPATGQLLGFFVTNARGLAPMLLSQLDVVTIPALLLPIVVGLAISRVTFVPPLGRPVPTAWTATGLATLVLVSAVVHLAPVDHRFDQYFGDTFLALRDLAPWRTNGQVEAVRRASRMPLIFDTSQATVRAKGPPPTKNVIVIMLESTRARSTSLYDPSLDTTPFMVDFAKRGAVVSTMYAGAPRTNAAWVSAIDGINCPNDGDMEAWTKRHRPMLRSLPMLLQPFGYASAFFTTANLWFMYDAQLVRSMRFGTVEDANTLPRNGFEEVSYTGYEDRMALEPSLAWVRQQRDAHKPFLLMMMTNVGHFPFTPPSTWPSRPFVTNDDSYNRYLNSLSYVDSVVKDFIGGLEKLGVLESSIVLILGDHGESMGEHGPRVHTLVIYDEVLRIPTVLYAPGQISPGSTIAGLRQEIDIVPTFLDLLGLELEHATLPGIPLTRPAPADRSVYFAGEAGAQFLAVRKGDLKFIYNYERTPTEVYSMSQDPDERHDLASTLDPRVIEDAETDMLVWNERVALAIRPPASAAAP